MSEVVVIGAGLFGSIISRALADEGHHVTVFDDQRDMSGSLPAACLMKPSWYSSSLTGENSRAALELLDKLYGLHERVFELRPKIARAIVNWVDPGDILRTVHLRETPVRGHVRSITRLGSRWRVVAYAPPPLRSVKLVDADWVVVAAGVWCNEILVKGPDPSGPAQPIHVRGLEARTGVAFLQNPRREDAPQFIAPWAPYRQIVGFDRGDGEWVSDGTANKELTQAHIALSMQRCAKETGRSLEGAGVLVGHRPYVSGVKPCYLQEHAPRLVVCTGGAKNGTIAAAWAANKMMMRLG